MKPFEIPEIKPPPLRVIKEEIKEEPPSIEPKNEQIVVQDEVKPGGTESPTQKTEVKSEISSEEVPRKLFGKIIAISSIRNLN